MASADDAKYLHDLSSMISKEIDLKESIDDMDHDTGQMNKLSGNSFLHHLYPRSR